MKKVAKGIVALSLTGVSLLGVLTLTCFSGCNIICTPISSQGTSLSDSTQQAIANLRKYCAMPVWPAQNKTYEKDDKAPDFQWTLLHVVDVIPENFGIEIDYMHDGTFLSRTVGLACAYTLRDDDWNTIIAEAPIENGKQKINWRIRYYYTNEEGLMNECTGWTYFYINRPHNL